MKTNYIYITTQTTGYCETWFILCDKLGEPFTDLFKAQAFCQENFCEFVWGLADYDNMMLNNQQLDNF